MGFLSRFLAQTESIQEPLCAPPKGGEIIQFDEEEQAAMEIALEIQARRDGGMNQFIMDAGVEPDQGWFKSMRQDSSIHSRRGALKEMAYERYANGQFALAAATCIKVIGMYGSHKGSDYRHLGSAEPWLMLAHIHACTGRFRTAEGFIRNATREAQNDTLLIGDMRTLWDSGVKSLESDVRAGRRPLPTKTILISS